MGGQGVGERRPGPSREHDGVLGELGGDWVCDADLTGDSLFAHNENTGRMY